MAKKEKVKKVKPSKKGFQSMLEDKYGIDLVDEYVTMLKKEKVLYRKSLKALKTLILELDPEADVEVTEYSYTARTKKKMVLKVKAISAEAAKAFDRYFKVFELGMKYSYPVIKGIEMKHDTGGKVAFNITIPDMGDANKK